MIFLSNYKNPSQHGFLKARSCQINLTCFLEEITKWMDEESQVDIFYLDFQKVFDEVPHQRVIAPTQVIHLHVIGISILNRVEQGRRPIPTEDKG